MADERPFFRLVDKLRLLAASEGWTSAFGEAADCIEALGAENKMLRERLLWLIDLYADETCLQETKYMIEDLFNKDWIPPQR